MFLRSRQCRCREKGAQPDWREFGMGIEADCFGRSGVPAHVARRHVRYSGEAHHCVRSVTLGKSGSLLARRGNQDCPDCALKGGWGRGRNQHRSIAQLTTYCVDSAGLRTTPSSITHSPPMPRSLATSSQWHMAIPTCYTGREFDSQNQSDPLVWLDHENPIRSLPVVIHPASIDTISPGLSPQRSTTSMHATVPCRP